MPHQCLKCGTIYDSTTNNFITGCSKCGHKMFLFVKNKNKEAMREELELTQQAKALILEELSEHVDIEHLEEPIILELENIRVIGSGKYEIDVNGLMKKNKPLIYRVEEGSYIIDLNSLKEVNFKSEY